MVAERARRVEISGIRRMFETAPPAAINLGLGEPDFDPPPRSWRRSARPYVTA